MDIRINSPQVKEWLTELAHLVNLERQCCPFLRLRITVEPDNGPFWLELTGTARNQRLSRNYFQLIVLPRTLTTIKV
jgi:hypothetical protein